MRATARCPLCVTAAVMVNNPKAMPLPKNTVAKNWSSRSPRRRRMTAMNHKKATTPKAARFNPSRTVNRFEESEYHVRSSVDDPTPGCRPSR